MDPNRELPIYHVHGYLPQKGEISELNRITLGESIYHKQYEDIYSWNNIVQINKYRDSNCLFIGTSLTDPNTRRLLDIAKRQKGEKDEYPHFIVKKQINKAVIQQQLQTANKQSSRNKKNNAQLDYDRTATLLIDIVKRFEESDSESFGIKTIWVSDWDEVPKIMEKIRTNAK